MDSFLNRKSYFVDLSSRRLVTKTYCLDYLFYVRISCSRLFIKLTLFLVQFFRVFFLKYIYSKQKFSRSTFSILSRFNISVSRIVLEQPQCKSLLEHRRQYAFNQSPCRPPFRSTTSWFVSSLRMTCFKLITWARLDPKNTNVKRDYLTREMRHYLKKTVF